MGISGLISLQGGKVYRRGRYTRGRYLKVGILGGGGVGNFPPGTDI